MKGVHGETVYSRLEPGSDGIVNLKVEELEGEVKNLVLIRTMRNVGFDSRWPALNIGENFEVTLER